MYSRLGSREVLLFPHLPLRRTELHKAVLLTADGLRTASKRDAALKFSVRLGDAFLLKKSNLMQIKMAARGEVVFHS
jgi:hypothetical protein